MVSRILLALSGVLLLGDLTSVVAQTPAAPAPFGHLQMSGDARGFWLFDQETGNIYRYDIVGGRTKRRFIGAVNEPGKPLNSVPAEYNPAAIPRSQRRALANTVLEELRSLVAAVDQWAIENNKRGADVPTVVDLIPYLHRASRLRYYMQQGNCVDPLGNPYSIATVDALPALSRATFDYFADVVPAEFWIPFPIAQ